MRVLGAVLGAAIAVTSACTSVKMVQRDGCWVKRTERWPARVREEVGPCARERGPWSEDRLVRLVQECVAAEDYRWRDRALAAWSRNEAWPAQPDDDSVLQACLSDPTRVVVSEVETLRERLADVTREREALRSRGDSDRRHLLATQDKLATYLGEAAKRAAPPAHATAYASSDGKARTDTSAAPATPASPVAILAAGVPAAACPAPPAAGAPAVPAAPAPEVAEPVGGGEPPATKAPARRARTTPRVKAPESGKAPEPGAPERPACEPEPCAGSTLAPGDQPNGNGTVTPTVAPANRDPSLR